MIWGIARHRRIGAGEIADRTWDFQRLSALTPWSMTWGKLLGASSLAWLCALTGMAVMLALSSRSTSRTSTGPWAS